MESRLRGTLENRLEDRAFKGQLQRSKSAHTCSHSLRRTSGRGWRSQPRTEGGGLFLCNCPSCHFSSPSSLFIEATHFKRCIFPVHLFPAMHVFTFLSMHLLAVMRFD
eukprot:1161213-Pelagomonas_calceolata.AAC.13